MVDEFVIGVVSELVCGVNVNGPGILVGVEFDLPQSMSMSNKGKKRPGNRSGRSGTEGRCPR